MIKDQPVLCIIHDLDGFERWRDSASHAGRVVLTWNNQVFRECMAADIDCLDAIDTVGAEAMDSIYQSVIKAAENWWSPQLDGLSYHGVDLAETMGRDMLYAFLDGLASWECTKRVLDKVHPKSVEVVDCGRRAFFWDPPGGPFPGVANGVSLWESERRGLPASLICKQPSWSPLPHRRNSPPGALPDFAGQEGPSLLFFLSNADFARLRPLISPMLKGRERTFLTQCGDFAAEEAGPAHIAWYEWLSHFPPDPTLCAEIAKRCAALKTPHNSFQKQHPALFDNPFIAFQWDAFAHQLELGGRIVDASNHLLEELEPDVCILGTATAGTWRTFTAAARLQDIPIAAMHHSAILPEWVLCGIWRHEADQLFIEGKLTRKMYERWGWSPQSLVEVGYPLMRQKQKTVSKTGPILIIPNEWDWGFALPAFVPRKRVEGLQKLAEMAGRMPDQSFVLKPHPKSLSRHLEEYRLAAATAPNMKIADPNDSIDTFMDRASAIIMLDSCSQAFLDACLSGAPVIHHRPSILDAQCNHSLQDLGYTPVTRNIHELETTLNALISDDRYRDEVIAKSTDFINDFSCINELDKVRNTVLERLNILAHGRKEKICCS